MFFKIAQQTVTEIDYCEIDSKVLTVGLISIHEFAGLYHEFGFDIETYEQCITKTSIFQNTPMVFANYSFGILHIINTKNPLVSDAKLAIYVMKHFLLVVNLYDNQERVEQSFFLTLEREKGLSKVSCLQFYSCFLSTFLQEDNQSLELLEIELDSLENRVMNSNISLLKQDFFYYRRNLLILRNYYEQYRTMIESITDNINQLFNSNQLSYLHQLKSRVMRLSAHTNDLFEFLSQIKESYMAQLDINLNYTMKYFTVVTSIFMPLALIVGWYGMNFKYMPELSWKYGYLFVIGFSVLVILITIIIFKKKKFF